ncbi:MAG: hypothetical protein AB8G05_22970 [Oligoflexales bacterium]
MGKTEKHSEKLPMVIASRILFHPIFLMGIFFSLLACQSGGGEQEKHQKDFNKAVAVFGDKNYDRAIELFSNLKGSSVDQVLVGNYLAQSYLESAGFDVLMIMESIASLDPSSGEEEFINTASRLIEIIPDSKLQTQEKFRSASQVFDDSDLYDFSDPLIFSYRTLYKSIFLIYHLKKLGEDILVAKSLGSIREKLEYLDRVRKSDAILQAEATIFDIVEMFPNLSSKIKKIVKRVIKDGVFKFTLNGKVFQLDFTNRHEGGIARLFFDLFESQLMEFASEYDLEELDLEVSIVEVKELAYDLIFGSKSIDELVDSLGEDERILQVEEKLLEVRDAQDDLLAELKKDAEEVDLDEYLDKDIEVVHEEIQVNIKEFDESHVEDDLLEEDLEDEDLQEIEIELEEEPRLSKDLAELDQELI